MVLRSDGEGAMSQQKTTAISPTRDQDYPEWYQQVIKAADLAELSPVRGCMVIKPRGFAIWENIQSILDEKFKDTGHVNAYFPLFIPLSYLEKEAEHVEGFAKECAVVTHHRLEADGAGGLKPAGPLEEPLVVRPTSEMIIGASYAKWIQSYRDLPVLVNQWANVVRWEMRTRIFLRTAEFLWQEGHTAHATKEEAIEETERMLAVYADFAEQVMAIPVVRGFKAAHERFPGALETMTIEAMMQDRKALQAGTSHFLGQNFAKAMGIRFQNEQSEEEYVWTTSWGVSTRLVGGLIMTHSDDDGLVLPPRLAPKQAVILPIYRNDEQRDQVLAYCQKLKEDLEKVRYHDRKIRIELDDRDIRGGEKSWQHIKGGMPLRIEVGPRDMEKGAVFIGRRDRSPKDKVSMARDEFVNAFPALLDEIQAGLFERAKAFRAAHTLVSTDVQEIERFFTPLNPDKPENHGGFVYTYVAEDPKVEQWLKGLKATHRCVPLDERDTHGRCIITGALVAKRSLLAKAY